MTDEEFQTLLRGSDANFRRFLIFLKFTGCRPGEAASMRWADVRFEESSVVLREHKTARKTGRPRIIRLVPTVIKLLLWMQSHAEAQGKVFDQEKAIVLHTRLGGTVFFRGPQRRQAEEMLKKGIGITAIHWGTGAETPEGEPWLRAMGGWFNARAYGPRLRHAVAGLSNEELGANRQSSNGEIKVDDRQPGTGSGLRCTNPIPSSWRVA